MSKVSDMSRTFVNEFPSAQRRLTSFGARLRLARKRRGISSVLMAERVRISRDTLYRVEKGDPVVSLGTYLRVLRVLGLDEDLDVIAKDDVLGRKLQDLGLEPAQLRSRRPKSGQA
jgi:transcriptional regulator with XRE-family HTH domain